MRFPPKMTLCLLAAIILVGLLFRFPLGKGHEMGSDTTFIHSLADSLVIRGSAAWILHPLSYFGLYALSYPSAIPFLFGSFSVASDVPVEGSILLMGFVFSIVGTLSAFAASRAAKDDDRLALIVALLFSVGPFYVKDTTWVGSSRGFVTALVPILFFLLLRHLRTRDARYFALCTLVVVLMGAIHRMGFLALLILIAYAFAIPLHRITQRLRFIFLKLETLFRLVSMGASISGFFALFYLQILFPGTSGSDLVSEYSHGALLDGSSFPILVANMMISLAGKVGILMPLIVLGLFQLAWDRPKEARDKFLLVAVLVMIPLLPLRDYIAEFLTYMFVLLLVLALIRFPKRTHRRKVATAVLLVALVGSSVGFSWVMKDYWSDRYYTDQPIPDELYGVAVYSLRRTEGTILSNEGLSQGRIAAITGRPALPLGGASIHWFSPQQLTFGFVDPGELSVTGIPLTSISFQTDAIFVPEGIPNAKDDYEAMFYNSLSVTRVQRLLVDYDVHFVFMTKTHPMEFESYIWRPSPLLVDLQASHYQVFQTESYVLWYVH